MILCRLIVVSFFRLSLDRHSGMTINWGCIFRSNRIEIVFNQIKTLSVNLISAELIILARISSWNFVPFMQANHCHELELFSNYLVLSDDIIKHDRYVAQYPRNMVFTPFYLPKSLPQISFICTISLLLLYGSYIVHLLRGLKQKCCALFRFSVALDSTSAYTLRHFSWAHHLYTLHSWDLWAMTVKLKTTAIALRLEAMGGR